MVYFVMRCEFVSSIGGLEMGVGEGKKMRPLVEADGDRMELEKGRAVAREALRVYSTSKYLRTSLPWTPALAGR